MHATDLETAPAGPLANEGAPPALVVAATQPGPPAVVAVTSAATTAPRATEPEVDLDDEPEVDHEPELEVDLANNRQATDPVAPPTPVPTPAKQILEALARGPLAFAEIAAELPAWLPTKIAESLTELALAGPVVAYFDPRGRCMYKLNPNSSVDYARRESLAVEPLSPTEHEAHLARIEREVEAMILAEIRRGTRSSKKIDSALRLPAGTARRVLKSLRERNVLAAKNVIVDQSGGEQESEETDGRENENDGNRDARNF